jgi:hypothetical protein
VANFVATGSSAEREENDKAAKQAAPVRNLTFIRYGILTKKWRWKKVK